MTQDTAHMPLDERGLAPCPFCGGEAKHFTHDPHGGWSNTDSIQCTNEECGAGTCLHETKEIAVKLWNRRAYLQTAAADVSGLVAELSRAVEPYDGKGVRLKVGALIPRLQDTLQTLSASNAALEAENARLREALSPFSVFAGVVFERNFNNSDPVDTMTASDGGVVHLYARDYFKARAALSAPKGGQDHG